NRLKKLPNEICNLPKLTQLYVGYNRLKTLPDSIGKLPLTNLFIHQNQINVLPDDFYDLTKLIRLNVSYAGSLFKFDQRICDMRRLEQLYIDIVTLNFSPRCLETRTRSNFRFNVIIVE
ncbi:MAG TPA: leucine-rich repeat domain-containing protein, partial [Crocinitomix sp.]|nr:leucine-rich repeat domain-containing protein [Crocinitomix sp.]